MRTSQSRFLPNRREILAGMAATLIGFHATSALSDSIIEGITQHWLFDNGYTEADLVAVSTLGLKDCAAWVQCGYSIDQGRLDNLSNGVNSTLVGKHFNRYVGTNTRKHIVTENGGDGVFDYSHDDQLVSEIASLVPTLIGKNNMHLMFGQDIYTPAWLVTALTSTPSQLSSRVTDRINNAKAKWAADTIYRVDVINEITNSATASSTAADRGWRTSGNRYYQAAVANGGEMSQWIWDAFTQAHAAWPSARLAMADFSAELPNMPLVYSSLSAPWGGNEGPFASSNEFAVDNMRHHRLLYETYRARVNGAPVDTINYQFHINAWAPPVLREFRQSLQDYYRFGILPAVCEFNVTNGGTAGTTFSAHMASQPLANRNWYSSWVANLWLKEMLQSSLCEEVSGWVASTNVQGMIDQNVEYPLMTVAKLAVYKALTPASRTIKRGNFLDGRFGPPLWLLQTGSPAVSQSSSRTAITGAGNLQIDESFFNAAWHAFPISRTNRIMAMNFQTSSAPANGSMLMGWGNATSGTPTNYARVVINTGNILHLDIVVGGVNKLSQDLGVVAVQARDHKFAVQINGTTVKFSIDGGPVTTVTAAGSFSDILSVSYLSFVDSSLWDAKSSYNHAEVCHGPDYAADEDLRQLSVAASKIISVPFTFLGNY